MESNSGLPPEILVLCTTNETKEKAVQLLEWIRHIPDVHCGTLAQEPALPAICALIASEQLGSTVVTERRALQWSQSTPAQFKSVMIQVQKLLIASRMHHQSHKGPVTLQALVVEFCNGQSALGRLQIVEKAFQEANKEKKWHLESDLVQLSIFIWSCRQFKIRTVKPIEEILQRHEISATSFNEIQQFLDERCLSALLKINGSPRHITTTGASPKNPPSPAARPSSASTEITTFHESSTSCYPVILEALGDDVVIPDEVLGGMQLLEKTANENEDLKHLADWSSTMGRCVIFYWTCSVLKIAGAKRITLRNRFQLPKKEFDKLLSVLDEHRGDLRKKLETIYASSPGLHSTSRGGTALAKPHYASPAPMSALSTSASGKRGRPPKAKSPPPMSLDPVSDQEHRLLPICAGPVLRRALLLMRSFNARRITPSEADRIPPESLPPMIALVASQQLGDSQIAEKQALQASRLLDEDFISAMSAVRASIDVFGTTHPFARQTTFDELALEHGLGIDTVFAMMHVQETLKESRCLSVGMDWDSPLVRCSVFFWTCAILKVPDVKQSLLRSRSLVSKREFDSMLQLLNSHCALVRHQLESNTAAGAFIFAPPPYPSARASRRNGPVPEGRNIGGLEGRDAASMKRLRRDTTKLSNAESDTMDGQRSQSHAGSKKRGRPPGNNKRDDDSKYTGTYSFQEIDSIYVPTKPFPPPDWQPPGPVSPGNVEVPSSVCPSSETGDSKRRYTRYSTADYEDLLYDRVSIWMPEGQEVLNYQTQYQCWEQRMARHYGPRWEKTINHEKPGVPFE